MLPGFLDLPERPAKPRTNGLTHVLDKGVPALSAEGLLAAAGEFIDIWKVGWGTAYVDRSLPAKLALLAQNDVTACLGGTLLEISWMQGRTAELFEWAGEIGCPAVEVSRGTAPMSATDKLELIKAAAEHFIVYAEVGSKRPGDVMGADQWAAEANADLDAGAAMVVAEGRESGTVGIYDETGSVRTEIVDSLVSAVGVGSVFFEAPRKAQQAWFIRTFGPEVNLGNVALDEAVSVETLRLGLRSDTVGIPERQC